VYIVSVAGFMGFVHCLMFGKEHISETGCFHPYMKRWEYSILFLFISKEVLKLQECLVSSDGLFIFNFLIVVGWPHLFS
jgi:hypothetical protein